MSAREGSPCNESFIYVSKSSNKSVQWITRPHGDPQMSLAIERDGGFLNAAVISSSHFLCVSPGSLDERRM